MTDEINPANAADGVAWIRSAEVGQTANYLKRGRNHASMPGYAILDRWKFAVQELAADPAFGADPGSAHPRPAENQLKAEIEVRRLAAPIDAVKADVEALTAGFIQTLERLMRDNPEVFAH